MGVRNKKNENSFNQPKSIGSMSINDFFGIRTPARKCCLNEMGSSTHTNLQNMTKISKMRLATAGAKFRNPLSVKNSKNCISNPRILSMSTPSSNLVKHLAAKSLNTYEGRQRMQNKWLIEKQWDSLLYSPKVSSSLNLSSQSYKSQPSSVLSSLNFSQNDQLSVNC